MPDRDGVLVHQDFFDQQPKDLLPGHDIERVDSGSDPSAEIGEAVNQVQVLGLVGSGRFKGLQLRLDCMVLLAQFWDPAA